MYSTVVQQISLRHCLRTDRRLALARLVLEPPLDTGQQVWGPADWIFSGPQGNEAFGLGRPERRSCTSISASESPGVDATRTEIVWLGFEAIQSPRGSYPSVADVQSGQASRGGGSEGRLKPAVVRSTVVS